MGHYQTEYMFQIRFIVIVLLLLAATKISGQSDIKGRLLTPEEGCGHSKVRLSKIVGGKFAKPGAWPWMAAIGYYINKNDEKVSFPCGGSLITSRHVLTAGHCVKKVDFVRLGAHDLHGNGTYQDAIVINTKKHPDYEESTGTDIAILYLQKDVDFTDHIRPICLPTSEPILSQSFIDTNPFIAGWGRTEENGLLSNTLQEAQITVLKNDLCKKLYDDANVEHDFSNRVICAGNLEGGVDACVGDSGGPLMLPIQQNGAFPFYQIGVVVFGIGCGRRHAPSGYANTQFHAPWIQESLV